MNRNQRLVLSDIKAKYAQSLAYAKNIVEDAKRIQDMQLDLSPDDYEDPEDCYQERMEDADAVHKASVYLQLLINMKSQLEENGINID
jgi:hypothetical protein